MVRGRPASELILLVYDQIGNKAFLRISRLRGFPKFTVNVTMSKDLNDFLGFEDKRFTEGNNAATRLCNPFVELNYLMIQSW